MTVTYIDVQFLLWFACGRHKHRNTIIIDIYSFSRFRAKVAGLFPSFLCFEYNGHTFHFIDVDGTSIVILLS